MSNEKPILFKDDQVRVILEGRQTQTRRFVPEWQLPGLTLDGDQYISIAQRHPRWGFGVFGKNEAECMANYNDEYASLCPYGKPGDRLWVRETFSASEFMDCRYRADGQQFLNVNGKDTNTPCEVKWTPSIHMPRWASRITLEITEVRVERLQDISEADAKAEGVEPLRGGYWRHYQPGWTQHQLSAKGSFATLWDSINGPGSWDANPWVWVIEFKRIDQEAKAA